MVQPRVHVSQFIQQTHERDDLGGQKLAPLSVRRHLAEYLSGRQIGSRGSAFRKRERHEAPTRSRGVGSSVGMRSQLLIQRAEAFEAGSRLLDQRLKLWIQERGIGVPRLL